MKSVFVSQLLLAGLALAQYSSNSTIAPTMSPTSSSNDTEYVTVTITTSACSTNTYTSTMTGSVTETICPICTQMGQSRVPGVSTTYTTVLDTLCPTGATPSPATYIITEPCGTTDQLRPSNYVPSGFTVGTVSCSCKGGSATLTTPMATSPTAAAPAAPATPTMTATAVPAGTTPASPAASPVQGYSNGTTCHECATASNGTAPVSSPIMPAGGARAEISIVALIAVVLSAIALL